MHETLINVHEEAYQRFNSIPCCLPNKPQKDCKSCLTELLYNYKSKRVYDCSNLIYFYFGRLFTRHTAQMFILLKTKPKELKTEFKIRPPRILSIGAGSSLDLFAFAT